MVKTEDFSHQGIFRAIREGSFYASAGPEILDFYVEDGVARVFCGSCRDIYFQTPHRGGHFHKKDGSLTEGSFDLEGDEEYVRVTVRDTEGNKAWTQPIWLWI